MIRIYQFKINITLGHKVGSNFIDKETAEISNIVMKF